MSKKTNKPQLQSQSENENKKEFDFAPLVHNYFKINQSLNELTKERELCRTELLTHIEARYGQFKAVTFNSGPYAVAVNFVKKYTIKITSIDWLKSRLKTLFPTLISEKVEYSVINCDILRAVLNSDFDDVITAKNSSQLRVSLKSDK